MSEPQRYSRRRVIICREGWYYIFVVTFIGGGAILRQVNPLFALAALMIAPLVFNWRIAMGMLNRLSIQRKLPARISAGERLVVDVEMTNTRHRLETLGINGTDRIRLIEPPLADFHAVAEFMIPRIRVKESTSATYRCILNRRGRYRFGPMRVSTRFPIGLVEGSLLYRAADEVVVAPRLGKLTPEWTNLVFRKQVGAQQSVSQRGANEGDFYAIRQWRSGDSKRWIHWRTTARLGSLAVKQFERHSERDLTVVLHLWHSAQPTESEQDAVEVAASS